MNAQLAGPSGSAGATGPGGAAKGATNAGNATSVAGSSSSGASATDGARVVVDVIGKVIHPGLVRLPTGSRVDDAVRAAGGAVAGTDLSSLNLARVLVDGEQIAVGVEGAAGPPGSNSTSGTGSGSALVNLNTATVAQLDAALPGVGPVLAQRIVDWRTTHGRFDSVDQLKQVSGVGATTFANLKPLVTV
ncbi:MAG: DNA-binding protein [Pseudonocardiales bacterium]|nr:DNA-binding protein [Pseudonocardiales bacterium]